MDRQTDGRAPLARRLALAAGQGSVTERHHHHQQRALVVLRMQGATLCPSCSVGCRGGRWRGAEPAASPEACSSHPFWRLTWPQR